MRTRYRFVAISLLLAVPLVFVSCGDSASDAAPQQQALPVRTTNPEKRTVALTEIYTGRFEPVEAVELRARVSGYLESVHFKEGQKVEKGDLMFQIDPRIFDAQVDAGLARVEQATARVNLAKNNLTRAEKLVGSAAISKEEVDIRSSEYEQAKADQLAAEAELRRARLDREFADVKAPISGIAGEFGATPGNFISGGAAAATLLTSIVPHHPIHCAFEVDERQILKFTRLFFEGKTDGRGGEQPTVEIAVSDRDEFEFEGKMDFADNQLDRSTATARLRALVENENEFLTPGLFAKVRVTIGEPFEAILVPDTALGFDQSKRFAWVLSEEGTVTRRFVETGALEGDMRIVEEGLSPEDTIVVSGIQLLQDGMPVAPIPNEAASPPTEDSDAGESPAAATEEEEA